MNSAFAFVGVIEDPTGTDDGLFLPVRVVVVVAGSKNVGDDALRNCSLSCAAVPSSGSWISTSMLLSSTH